LPKNILSALTRVVFFLFTLMALKIRKTKIVWTVHNIKPHENYHPYMCKLMMYIFTNMLDAIVIMSKSEKDEIIQEYPALKRKVVSYIPHPLYHCYPNDASLGESRKQLGIPLNATVFTYFGQIRDYKNIPELLRSFEGLDRKDCYLIVAGAIKDQELKLEIMQLSKNARNLKLKTSYIPENEIQYYMNASDVVVLPFKNILNSGSAMLALSFGKPLLCPEIGALKGLQDIFGKKWIFLYKNNIFENIEHILKTIRTNDYSIGEVEGKLPTKDVVAQHIQLFKQIA